MDWTCNKYVSELKFPESKFYFRLTSAAGRKTKFRTNDEIFIDWCESNKLIKIDPFRSIVCLMRVSKIKSQ